MSSQKMADEYNDIFGYKVYKPPPDANMPMIEDLNCFGEIVTLIDTNADVIQDPAVQKIFQGLDGERTVKIEDLAPDIRYAGWNKKSQYDNKVIMDNIGSRVNMQPTLPFVNQNLLKPNDNQHYQQEGLKQAQRKAADSANNQQEFSRQIQATRLALEKEIQKQLIEQLMIREQKQSVTPEQQALIEKLYLDLRLVNPDLALATLKASTQVMSTPTPQTRTAQPVPTGQPRRTVGGAPPQMVHNQGSIVASSAAAASTPTSPHKSSKSSRKPSK